MGVEMARALGDIVVERDKQRRVLGYGNDRDDQYTVGQLASAAAMYAYASTFLDAKRDYLRTARTDQDGSTITINLLRHLWPNNWKPPTWRKSSASTVLPRRDLTRTCVHCNHGGSPNEVA